MPERVVIVPMILNGPSYSQDWGQLFATHWVILRCGLTTSARPRYLA